MTRCQIYLVMTALFGAIVGVLDAGALWLLGVPLPLVWGFFSFITNFIPNIGFIIGIIPPAFLALLDQGWQGLLSVVLVYSVLNVTIQTFIQPRIVGNSVGLSGEITFMSLVVWTFLLGALGALLAVPMTLLLRAIFIDADPRASWVAPLIDAKVEDDHRLRRPLRLLEVGRVPGCAPRDQSAHTVVAAIEAQRLGSVVGLVEGNQIHPSAVGRRRRAVVRDVRSVAAVAQDRAQRHVHRVGPDDALGRERQVVRGRRPWPGPATRPARRGSPRGPRTRRPPRYPGRRGC